jgi:hypothetical protein
MVQGILVGLVAGLAAALLFVALFGGTPLGIPLFILTGVPIAIAGFGWGIVAALVAAAVGIAVATFLTDFTGAAIFAVIFAIPVTWTTAAVILPRLASRGGGWRPLGQVLTHAAVAMGLAVIGLGLIVGYDPATLTGEITSALADLAASADTGAGAGAAPTAADLQPFVALNVMLMPASVAIVGLAVIVLDLYLAAKSVRLSGGLKRPEENLSAATLPIAVPAAFVGATALAFAPGSFGHAAEAIAGALGGALAMNGLAVIHALTRGVSGRVAILSTVYALLVPLSGLMIAILTVIGLIESVFHIRSRRLTPRGPTAT